MFSRCAQTALCVLGWGLSGRNHGSHMDALREWMESDLDVIMESDLDGIMVGRWMLCVLGWGLSGRYHGWPRDALRAHMGFEWTLSWFANGCSAGMDGG